MCLVEELRCLEQLFGLYVLREVHGLNLGIYGRVESKMEKKRALKLP